MPLSPLLGLRPRSMRIMTMSSRVRKPHSTEDWWLEPNFVAADKADIQFAVKELAKDTAKPKNSSWNALVRLGKYLKRRPRCAITFKYQSHTSVINASTDADWAGDQFSRKSTSGGVLQFGTPVIKSWSSTQSVIALSSGESEFSPLSRAAHKRWACEPC